LNEHKIATVYVTGCRHQKIAFLTGIFFVFVPENWLVIYYEHIVTDSPH